MSDTRICPCDAPDHPRTITNPPGRDVIRYRAGDYVSFRDALLRTRPGEIELANWGPGAEGDMAVQMMEWWAYLADILTFYNERVANQQYLGTADLPESVRRLIRLLGYRPRPGIEAYAGLGALLSGAKPVGLAAGFQVQSKPGPGKQPQIFELDRAVSIAPPTAVAAEPAEDGALFAADGSVLLAGAVTSVKPGDALLILASDWSGRDEDYALVNVSAVAAEMDPLRRPNTRLHLKAVRSGIPSGAKATDYRLLRSTLTAKPWPYPTDTVIATRQADLDSLARGIAANQPVLLDIAQIAASGSSAGRRARRRLPVPLPQLVEVTSYAERIWYANPKSSADPSVSPTSTAASPVIAIPIPHTLITFTPAVSTSFDFCRNLVVVRYGWQDVATLIVTPPTVFDGAATALVATGPGVFQQGNSQPILIEDANGTGVAALGSVGVDATKITLAALPDTPFSLKTPLRVFFAPLAFSRGKTVAVEVLGSGNAAQANQSFVLNNKPLTYLFDPGGASGDGFASTLQIWVDGIEWHEKPSFYDQAADARVFVTREDETQATTVSFGDGVNGARLTSGLNNVIARYRFGSGRDAPDAGSLSVVVRPTPGLQSLRNPVPATGGDDPDPPDKIRRYAPGSVLAFGRAVSGDDYEVVAAQAPGVARARAYFAWDAQQQRALVTVYVGDDPGAEGAARTALNNAADPNRPFTVKHAIGLSITLTLTVLIASDRAETPMLAALTAALADPDTGLFGSNAVLIGASIYRSMIYDSCLEVPGTIAVHALTVAIDRGSGPVVEDTFRFDPGEGGFFTLAAEALDLTVLQVVADAG